MEAFITEKGFTLIELLVVVLIIGILSSVALPQYTKAVEKARLTEAQTMLNSLQQAMDVYILSNGYVSGNITSDSLDINYAGFSPAMSSWYCNASHLCFSLACTTNSCDVSVGKWPKDELSSAPNYPLYGRKSAADGKWVHTYSSCRVDISKFGLESLGYTSESC